jgi:autotransporter-associated beta strand protein
LAINEAVTNAVVNISGGTLYCHQIGMDGATGIPTNGSTDTLNISGGTIYIGDGGVNSNNYVGASLISQVQSVNISGGTFHTADMLCGGTGIYTNNVIVTNGTIITTNIIGVSIGTGTNGDTNTILADGTNWTWAVDPPVNLTNTAFPVLGTNYGPGYVTFAPEATRVITLSNVWSGQGGFVVTGPGQVILAGANTYTGNTTVSGGELSLSGGGAIASPIIVANGATFDVSGLTSTFALASGQTLSNSSSTAILNGSAGSGSGTISLTYASGTPSFTVANGTLTLSAGTVFNVNNTGSALGPGTYTLIGTNVSGIVAGAVPSSYTVGGNGVSGTSSLVISNNTLDLVVVSAGPVVSPIISGPAVNGSGNPTFSGTGASDSTVYGVESTTSLSGIPVWIEAGTTTTDGTGAWSFTDIGQTNPPTIFYRLYNPDDPGSPPQ